MSPQLHLSTYSEEFNPPGHRRAARPSQARPSSAYRRNNPHPRPDFLFPRKPQTGRGPRPLQQVMAPLALLTPVAQVAPLFPPVRHMSVQCPEDTPAHAQAKQKAADKEVPHKATFHSPKVCVLPPADWLSKPQLLDVPAREKQNQSFLQRKQGKFTGKEAQRRGQIMEPHITPSVQTFRAFAHYSRTNSKATADASGGHSCFHVVKPYKASFYVIHPEFVSEYQR
ncbi:hypothetical protein ACEWY4_003963 [Coilia grayii]|uniref:Uncharacterized protein n=1 Tax=Coilia grayii TaxID=363190 RepID=A0ABD1KK62_9TELE